MNHRLTEVYNRLVDETENPETLRNERKNHLLHKLCELVEYVMEFDDTNPLDKWFNDDEPNAVAPNELFDKLAFGPQEPPDNPMIFNRRQPDGSYRPISEFFDSAVR